jgi:hypothetical protein
VIEGWIRFFVEAKHRPAAERLVAGRLEAAGLALTSSEWEPYPKTGGWVGSFNWKMDRASAEWPIVVYELLQTVQRIGYQWIVSGRIEESLELLTNHPAGYGITMITLSVRLATPEQ